MKESGVGCLLIRQGEEIIGILTGTDILHKVVVEGLNPQKVSVKEVMSAPVISIHENKTIGEAEELMECKKIRHLVVEKKGEIAGVVSIRDLLFPLQYYENLSIHDGLTGLLNKKEFTHQIKGELSRSQRFGHCFSLLMLDIDHFKLVNDTHGHPSGDKVLIAVSKLIQSKVRGVDQVFRYGGEEFAFLLPETSRLNALSTGEKIRRAVASKKIRIKKDEEISLTVSIGIAVFPEDGNTVTNIVDKADQALYKAKQSGRNRVF
jgi:diguanylate cyclase (GGDEF)-like protein